MNGLGHENILAHWGFCGESHENDILVRGPYGLDLEGLSKFCALCHQLGWKFKIKGISGHCPGRLTDGTTVKYYRCVLTKAATKAKQAKLKELASKMRRLKRQAEREEQRLAKRNARMLMALMGKA